MPEPGFRKITPGTWEIRFDYVVLDSDGSVLGFVRKRSESFRGIRGRNGRRLGEYTYWDAYDSSGEKVSRGWRTRRDAASALLAKEEV